MLLELEVERCHVEVVTDRDPLSLHSLQSSFPGATGLFYYPPASKDSNKTKCSLNFDGKAFHPPAEGGWSSVDRYFVTLGGRNTFPFDSYQNASKQLERTVATIQKLMSAQGGDLVANGCHEAANGWSKNSNGSPAENGHPSNIRDRYGSFRHTNTNHHVATLKSSRETNNNRVDLWLPHKNSDEWEKQFAELSSIVVGKNAIIESQRRQLQTERAANEELEKANEKIKSELDEWKQKWQVLDRELHLMREMGGKQEYMGSKVKMLNLELENLKNSNNTRIEELQQHITTLQHELKTLNERHEFLQSSHTKLVSEIEQKDHQLADYHKRVNRLQTDLEKHQEQWAEQSKCSHDLEERLCKENIGLAEWSKKLELDNKDLQLNLHQLQGEMEDKMSRMSGEFERKLTRIQDEYKEKCKETENLHGLIDSLNRHLTQITQKYNKLSESYEEFRKSANGSYTSETRSSNSSLIM